MKRIFAFMLCALLALSFVGCASKGSATTDDTADKLDMSLEEIFVQLIEKADVGADTKQWLQDYMQKTYIDESNMKYFIGVENADISEGLAVEPMMSSQAFSLSLLRLNEGADADKLMSDMKAGVDPAKWICVSVEEKDILTAKRGDVVILIMSELSGKLLDAFNAIGK